MTSGRSKRPNFLLLVFIIKSISKKLLIKVIITARNHFVLFGYTYGSGWLYMYVYNIISQLPVGSMYHIYIIHYAKLHYY